MQQHLLFFASSKREEAHELKNESIVSTQAT